MELLLAYDFPGNVRELRNILNRAALLTDDVWILPEHLPANLRQSQLAHEAPGSVDFSTVLPLAEMEARYLRWARLNHAGDRRSLARSLGLSERTLYRKLEAVDDPSEKGERDHG
ncbi:helix-turn-helix domain-containing protein [Acidithiobacillus sp. AMEEHan]|uniref:helix-turn-helix domain-containing protein n=1 Tax=Acidithiobacillus sp. AMEEHan TaxID=2994951 RepID=UPI0027E3B523|nr:hypothetical protein [Acidithiobacillus sp. AMEEHan]